MRMFLDTYRSVAFFVANTFSGMDEEASWVYVDDVVYGVRRINVDCDIYRLTVALVKEFDRLTADISADVKLANSYKFSITKILSETYGLSVKEACAYFDFVGIVNARGIDVRSLFAETEPQ